MRNTQKCALAMVASAMLFSAVAWGEGPAAVEDKVVAKCGASIQIPKGWTLVDVPGAHAFVFARSPTADSDGGQEFWANINVNRTGAAKGDLLTLARAFQAEHKGVYADYTVTLSPKEVAINGQKAVVFGGAFTTRGLKMRNQQWFVAGSDRGYWITLTALAAGWQGRVDAAEAAVGTFRLVEEGKGR